MILADENIHAYIVQCLRDAGLQVDSIREHSRGISDEKVIEYALLHDGILLTQDKDFGEWVIAHHIRTLSVIFLRYSFPEYKHIAETVVELLKNHKFERPYFATVTTKKIRLRNL